MPLIKFNYSKRLLQHLAISISFAGTSYEVRDLYATFQFCIYISIPGNLGRALSKSTPQIGEL